MALDKNVSNKSLIDLARLIMADERKVMNFNDIFNRVADLKGLTEEQRKEKIAQFYTDLNVGGHFMTTGANNWGLRGWDRRERLEKRESHHTVSKRGNRNDANNYEHNLSDLSMMDEHIDDLDDDLYEYDDIED